MNRQKTPKVNIKAIEESSITNWERLISDFPVNPFVTADWMDSVQTTNKKPVFIKFHNLDKIIAISAGLVIESQYPLINRLSRRLFLFTGPIISPLYENYAHDVNKALIRFSRSSGYHEIFIGSYDYPSDIDYAKTGFSAIDRDEFLLDLRRCSKGVYQSLRQSAKKNVKKASKSGLTYKVTTETNAITDLTSCLEETRIRKMERGYEDYSFYYMPYLTFSALRMLLKKKYAHISSVYLKEELLCSAFTVIHKNRAYGLLAGCKPEGYRHAAAGYRMYMDIKFLQKKGVEFFNLAGIPKDHSADGLIKSKMSFGAERMTCRGAIICGLQGPFLNTMAKLYNAIRKMI